MAIENPAELTLNDTPYLPALTPNPYSLVPGPHPSPYTTRSACRLVSEMTDEMTMLISGRVQYRRDRRRRLAHVRQIAMYVCHVCLQIQQNDIAQAFGRDPTTVRYACHMVEDRRDDSAYDDFIASIERMVASVFSAWEETSHA